MHRIPILPKRLLKREKPLRELRRLIDYPLTIVCAPAGYGKTTLAADALKHLATPQIWIELDSRHGLAARFYTEIMLACRKLWPDFAPDWVWDRANPHWPDPESVLLTLVHELEKKDCHLVTVFDDSINDREGLAWQALSVFLDRMPEKVHAVLLCRERPSLNLSRWRLSRQLLEMGAGELAVPLEEVGRFLETVSGAKISAESIANVHRLSEGWIAGLQLIALRLQGESDPEAALLRMDWNHPFLFEYLMEEVLSTLAPDQREFLLMTSVLPRLKPGLCEAVTGSEEAAKILAQLLERNVFVTRDSGGDYARYHRLFAEGLQGLLRQWKPGLMPLLHRRAARWNLQQHQIEEAFEHALEARDADTLEALAARALENIFRNSDFVALERHALRIPEALSEDRPCLALFLAWALFHLGREAEGRIHLDRAHRSLRRAPESPLAEEAQRRLLAHVFHLRGILLRLDGDVTHAVQLAYRAFVLAPQEGRFLKASLQVQIGIGSFLTGHLPEAVAALKDAMDFAEGSEHHLAFFGAGYTLSEIYRLQGYAERQTELHRALLGYAERSPAHSGPASGYAFIARARILLDQGRVGAARLAAEQGLALGRKGDNIRILNYGHAAMALVLSAEGEVDAALKRLTDAETVARRNRMHWGADLDDLVAMRLRLQFESGKKVEEYGWLMRQRGRVQHPSLQEWDVARTVMRLLLLANRYGEAMVLIEIWEGFARKMSLPLLLVELKLLRSVGQWGRARRQEAKVELEEALAEIERLQVGGLLRGLALPLKPIAAEFKEPVSYGNTEDTLLGNEGVSALSEREMEVLRAMREGKSNKEIAITLYVAPSTVKTHLKNIFAKLQVSNRTRAVTLAEEAGWLR